MGDPQDLNAQEVNPRRAKRAAQAPVDAVFEEIVPAGKESKPKKLKKSERPRDLLTYQPYLHPLSQEQVQIMGYRDDAKTIPWGFWGGVALIVVLLGLVFFRGSSGMFSMMDFLIALTLGGGAAVLFKWGPQDSAVATPLAVLDLAQQQLSWHAPDSSGQGAHGQVTLQLEQIKEIVYAMIHFPVSPTRPDVQIQVFTLLVRDDRDQLLPIIEASPSKEETYDIAQALSRWSGLPISQVGEGVFERA